jgi:hypothetical protein
MLLGQQASPGKHLHSTSRSSHSTAKTAGASVAKKAREKSPVFEENMMIVMKELNFYKGAVNESLLYNIAEGFSTDSCMIAQIGPVPTEEIICEYQVPFYGHVPIRNSSRARSRSRIFGRERRSAISEYPFLKYERRFACPFV